MTVHTLKGTALPGVKASVCVLKIILHAVFSMIALRKRETPVVCGFSQDADKPTP